MNMMSLQERSEEQAVPDFVRELRADFGIEDAGNPDASDAPATPVTLLERIGWFRNLSLAGKINTIFGTFLGLGVIMSLVLGLGLGELWNRYQNAGHVRDAVIAARELQAASGELRYYSVRALYDRSPALREQQSASENAITAQIAVLDPLVAAIATDLQPRAAVLRTDLGALRTGFERARNAVRDGAAANAVAAELDAQGAVLVAASAQLAADLTARGKAQEAAGTAYFYNMVMIIGLLSMLGCAVLLLGLTYLSRDFSRKIVEITAAMTRLANGDRGFEIEGEQRTDEIGAMIRALDLFKRASKRLETWARERSEKAEQELQLQQDRERERVEAEARKAALLDDVARQFERTVGDVVSGVAAASSQLHTTATRMASSAEEASRRTNDVAVSMDE
ncbi:MAG: HAMP domain-containing protein, partial [Erythrobacter sp.]|nr:HAMP domain-containing protein [Erythrobacter sp.]